MPIFDSHIYLEGCALPGVNQNAAQVSQMLGQRGIERAILLSARAARVDPVSGNRILKAMLEQSEGLYGSVTAHLNRVDASLQSIKEMLGTKRFLSLTLATQEDTAPHPALAEEILNTCRRYHKPIFIYTPNAACVEAGAALAARFSTLKFVFLGMGGHDWRAAIAAAHSASNVMLETSGPLDRAKIPAAIAGCGAHRLLFGSAMPFLDPAAALGLLEDADLSPADLNRIQQANAMKLFDISAVEAVPMVES